MKLKFKTYLFASLLISFYFGEMQNTRAQASYQAPPLPTIPNKTFNIKDFGAVSNQSTDNTQAIQKAVDAAEKAGGGKVIIPAGEYLSGPIQYGSNLELHLDAGATLKMLPINQYPGNEQQRPSFLYGKKLHDIALTGEGTIDGQGSPWWPLAKTSKAERPRMIEFKDCDKVLFDGVTLMNSPKFHITVGGNSSNLTVQNVTISAPASTDPVNPSHNTDACDVSAHHVLIQNCKVSVGDDDFTCGGGTDDVLIRNCTYGYGHGVSIGSPIRGGVSNITVENCTFTNTEFGIRIKSDRDRGGVVENMTYKNLTMNNVNVPILIYASYNAKEKQYRDLQKITPEIANTYPDAELSSLTPVYRNFTFENITATTAKGKRAGLIWGLPEALASNIKFINVNIKADRPFGIFYANQVQLENCNIQTSEGKNKLDLSHAQVSINGKNVHD